MVSAPVQARVFSFNDAWVSAYFRGTGGVSKVGDNAYEHTSGSLTAFEDEVDYNFSGEIGFAFQMSEFMAFRIGAEGLQTKGITVTGTNAAGTTDYMDIESKSVVFNPNATLEYSFLNTGTSRLFLFAGAGYSDVKVTNDYALTAAGQALYGAPASYKETWSSMVLNYNVGVGYEVFALDNVTFSIDTGWRFFKVSDFEYDSATTVVRGGASQSVAAGASVTDNLGNDIELDLGGVFVGVAFKFYIPPLN